MKIRNRFRAFAQLGVGALCAASLACSFSCGADIYLLESSLSSSENLAGAPASSSRSDSIYLSSSSSPESNASKYRNDVTTYTAGYVVSNGSAGAFLNGIGDLARKRGITNWESNRNTWRGIGQGLGRARVEMVQLSVYEKSWAGDDPDKVKLIRKGYRDPWGIE